MGNIFILAFIIAIIFFIGKFVEMRFIDKESKPLKYLIRDSLLVYVSVISGHFIIEQLKPVINEASETITAPGVFTGDPNF